MLDNLYIWVDEYTEAQAQSATLGMASEIADDNQWNALTDMWTKALVDAGYKPNTRPAHWLTETGRIAADVDRYFGMGKSEMSAKAKDRLYKAAIAGGIDIMLDSFLSGVSAEHICA